jgi:hypothetical protein
MRTIPLVLLTVAATLATADPSTAARRRAWVTSVTGTGNLASWPDAGGLGALAAGDAICRARAAAAGLPNANAYRVWLSTAATDAYCHVQGLTGKRSTDCDGGTPAPSGPWYRVSAAGVVPATENLDALVDDGVIYRSILYDEFGQALHDESPTRYWTGTRSDGTVDASNCTSWVVASPDVNGVRGDVTTTAQAWSWGASASCDQESRLLCLEPGLSESTGQKWLAPASLVFLTSEAGTADLGSWPQADGQVGLAAGDAICRSLAVAAHLPAPDSFVAWLSSGAVDAADRLTSNGPFRRIDGVLIASSKADLLDLSNSGSIHQFETGAYQQGGGGGHAWTGTEGSGTATGEDCSAWTSASNSLEGRPGAASSTLDASWSGYGNVFGCGFTSPRLYCFSNVVTIFWDGFETGDALRWSEVAP